MIVPKDGFTYDFGGFQGLRFEKVGRNTEGEKVFIFFDPIDDFLVIKKDDWYAEVNQKCIEEKQDLKLENL